MAALKNCFSDAIKLCNRFIGSNNDMNIRGRCEIAKIPLCLLIGCSTLFGFLLAEPHLSLRLLRAGLGVFLLAAGAATLNSAQEYRLDGKMKRTQNRPLPMGILSLTEAGFQAVLLIISGLILLWTSSQALSACFVAVVATVLYNGIYTPLKKMTILAIVPGVTSGALPPYIGWLAGGGVIVGYVPGLMIALLILWQIPHLLLVLLNHREDYISSRLPHLLEIFRERKLQSFFVTWIGALSFIMILFITLPIDFNTFIQVAVVFNAVLLILLFFFELVVRRQANYLRLFISLNSILFFHMAIVAAGAVYA